MKDEDKTKDQLINELVELRRRIAELEKAEIERKRAEEELIRLSSAVKMATDSIVISDLEAKIVDVNEATLRMYGTDDRRELIGKNSFDLIAPEDREKALTPTQEVLETGYIRSQEYHIIAKDGSRIPVEMSVALIKDPDGNPIGFVGINRDITERKRAEERIKHLNLVLRAIRRVNQLIAKEKDRERLLKGACVSLIETRGHHNAWIALLDESGGLVMTAEAGLDKDFLPMVERLKRGELTDCGARALGQSEVVVTEEPLSTCADCPLADKYRGRGAMTVRLEHGGKVYGLMSISVPKDLATDEEERTLFKEVGGDISFGLHDIELEEERKRAEEEVQRHLERLEALREIDRAISSTLDLSERLDIILEQLEGVLPYTSAAIFLLTDDTAKVTAGRGFPNLEEAMQVSFSVKDDVLTPQLLAEKRPLVLVDAQADKRFRARGGTEYVRSWIGVPLIVRGEAIGFLTIDHKEPGVYDGESAETALAFASQAALAIENAHAYERLKTQNLETISALAAAVEVKDPYTSGHSHKVTEVAIAIAERMGLSNDEIEDLRVAGLLHDIGKIGIPDSVLNKPARLTSAERVMVEAHPVIAAEIVEKVEALAHLVPIIRHHHEWYDGNGYPDGLKGKKIPLGARILAVADGFEAMTAERPYRFAKSQEEAIEELKAGAGTQWDPKVVEVFVKICRKGTLKHQASRE